jgi:hypothetical protein
MIMCTVTRMLIATIMTTRTMSPITASRPTIMRTFTTLLKA